ncbi:MFS general substrate transporter, partial [Aspergillus homomorphus CBS 101889]
GTFLASVDESLVISTYSTISSQFQRLSEGSWLLVAYNLGYCVSLPVYGVVSDRFDKKRVLIGSYLLFTLGSIACGASTSLVQLALARVIAGIGGAGMVILVSIVLTCIDIVKPEDVAIYRGYENTVYITGRSLGAPIGGLLIDTIGWRWSFIGQVPIAIACIMLVGYLLPELRPKTFCRDNESPFLSRVCSFDFLGIISFTVSVILLLVVLHTTGMQKSDRPDWAYIALIGLILAITLFILTEVYWAKNPLLPTDLTRKSLGGYCSVQFLLFAGRNALVSSLIPYFIRTANTSDLIASLSFVLTSLGVSAGGLVSGYLIKRTRQYKIMELIALCLSTLIYVAIFIQWQDGCSIWESLYLFASGLTLGIVFSSQFVGMSASSPKSRLASCIGAYYLSQQLGFIVGPAAGLALVQGLFASRLGRSLVVPDRDLTIKHILDDARYTRMLPAAAQRVVRESYLYGFKFAPVLSVVCNLAALLVVLHLRAEKIL